MTLTAIIPTLRSTLPDPIRPESWPAGTTLTTTDVLLHGQSLHAEAAAVSLPYLHRCDDCSVVLARVIARLDTFDGRVDLVLGCRDDLDYDWQEARLLGRVSVARAGRIRVSSRTRWQGKRCQLPSDVEVGDLVAVPIRRA